MCAKSRPSGNSTRTSARSARTAGAAANQQGTDGGPLQNTSPNGFAGTKDGADISDTWHPSSNQSYRGQEIEEVMDAQGFRGKPKIITDQAEFDKAAQAAWGGKGMVMVRGIGAPDQTTLDAYSDTLTHGEWYVRCDGGAAHGYGQYAAYRYGSSKPTSKDLSEANDYAQWNGKKTRVFTMTLDPSAKIGEERQLRADMRAHNAQAQKTRNSMADQAAKQMPNKRSYGAKAALSDFKAGSNSGPKWNTSSQYKADYAAAMTHLKTATASAPHVYNDVGVFAASKGYDFYYDRGTGYSVTLNRTKLIIKG